MTEPAKTGTPACRGRFTHQRRNFLARLSINAGNRDACFAQNGNRIGGTVIIQKQHGPSSGCHGIAVDIGAYRARQHHAGQIVLAKQQRPLDRTARQHAARGDDFNKPLARLRRRRLR